MSTQHNQLPHTTATCAWLSGTVKHLVDDPDAVSVAAVEGATTTILEITVAPPDIRRIIGKRGRVADGLRAILVAIGGKNGHKVHMEIVEPSHRFDEIPGEAGLGVPVKVERKRGGDIRIGVEHGD